MSWVEIITLRSNGNAEADRSLIERHFPRRSKTRLSARTGKGKGKMEN